MPAKEPLGLADIIFVSSRHVEAVIMMRIVTKRRKIGFITQYVVVFDSKMTDFIAQKMRFFPRFLPLPQKT